MFLHFSAHNFGTQRANFATQRSSLNNCFSCHVMSIVSTPSCFQFNSEPLNHVVRQHVRALNARASAPPLPLSFFMPSRQKGTPTRCILEHEVPSTQCKTSLPSHPYSCGCAEFQPQRLFPLCPLRLSHNISQLCCCLGINRPLYCLTSIYLPCS